MCVSGAMGVVNTLTFEDFCYDADSSRAVVGYIVLMKV